MNKNAGFTLIELLVVVLIIGILSAVALPQYTKAVEKSRAAGLMPLLRALDDANQRYYLANGVYSVDLTSFDVDLPANFILADDHASASGNRSLVQLCGAGCHYSVQGYPNTDIPYYIEFYTSGGKRCWASKNSPKANEICRALSGQNSVLSDSHNNGYTLIF